MDCHSCGVPSKEIYVTHRKSLGQVIFCERGFEAPQQRTRSSEGFVYIERSHKEAL